MIIGTTFRILCRECGEPILTRDDLITAFRFLVVKPMHAACFGKSLRGFRTIFMNNFPLNGAAFMFYASIFALLGIFSGISFLSSFSGQGALLDRLLVLLFTMGIFSIPLLIRYYSWIRYEKKLPE